MTSAAPPPLRAPKASEVGTPSVNQLAAAHARFAKAALSIYFAAAAIAIALLVVALLTDKTHDEEQVRRQLLVETDLRAHALNQHLALLVEELRRLGLRSEVDLLDQNLAPEQSLLKLSHEKSTFFNLGIGILDDGGRVIWAEPSEFLKAGTSFAKEEWFTRTRKDRTLRFVPIEPEHTAILYLVSPIVRARSFTGALVGGLDFARSNTFDKPPASGASVVLASAEGLTIFPEQLPAFAEGPAWAALFTTPIVRPTVETRDLGGVDTTVASAPVGDTGLSVLTVAPSSALFGASRDRLVTRLVLGLLLAFAPLLVLVRLLNRSLAIFRQSEETAVRQDRLRLLGEAANAISHEVKNALNGLGMGLELVVRKDARSEQRRERVLGELRREIQRLSEFTTELMTFSRGIDPKRSSLDLKDFLTNVTALAKDAATELGTSVDLELPEGRVVIDGDATLLHSVVSNLVSNGLDAVSGVAAPRVRVVLDATPKLARVRVIDNGPGVSPSMRLRLFEPFQTEKPNGVGIGLALAHKIARAHGGDLVLEDGPGGASFLLTLPLEKP